MKASDPITINKTTLRNRITMAPTVKFDYAGEDGKATEKHIEHYRERSVYTGLVCVEATAVLPGGRFGFSHMGLWEDPQIEGHRAIAAACHDNGSAVIIQLNHTGAITNPAVGEPVGPSEIPGRGGVMSRSLTVEEIRDMQKAFVDAAVRAQKAGYDGIQLHACHGYLINQFECADTNKRTDEYGGGPENRARFASEIIREIRNVCGEDFLISARTIGADPDLESALAIAEEYVKAGCDYLQVSSGITDPDPSLVNGTEPYNLVCSLGVHFHEHFAGRVPVSCVNGILEPSLVDHLIENDLVDTVDLGRAMLADPAFPNAVLTGADFVKCFDCKSCQYGPRMPHNCPAAAVREKNASK